MSKTTTSPPNSKSNIHIIALGGPVGDSLEAAIKRFGSKVNIVRLPHPCTMSAQISKNGAILAVGSCYDNFLGDEHVCIRGIVIMRGLWSDNQEKVGVNLGSIMVCQSAEISDGTAETNPHNDVVTFCRSQGILNDEMAAQELIRTGRNHLALPWTRNAYYLSESGKKGGPNSSEYMTSGFTKSGRTKEEVTDDKRRGGRDGHENTRGVAKLTDRKTNGCYSS
jgi:hypothetical protein